MQEAVIIVHTPGWLQPTASSSDQRGEIEHAGTLNPNLFWMHYQVLVKLELASQQELAEEIRRKLREVQYGPVK
jgi:hypothetical protein